MNRARQLSLDLPHRTALGRADFLVGGPNAAAVAAIDAWPDWPYNGLVLVGPGGGGKSHLVEVWRERSGARRIGAGALPDDPRPLLDGVGALAVEDCGPAMNERAMFHLLNEAERAGADVLLTGRAPPGTWDTGLADLASRLRRLPVVALEPPDDPLLAAVIVKLFADRQLSVEPPVVDYIVRRIERSFDAIRAVVERIDRVAIEEQRPVTRTLAARILSEAADPER